MDDRRFDSLVKTLSSGGSRRGMLQTLGAGALAAVAARFGLADDAEAKKKRKNKKKKKCKGGTKKCNGTCIPQDNCCVDDDCGPKQFCEGGQCKDAGVLGCESDADCRGGAQICQNGVCVVVQECQVAADCAANESCIDGVCQCQFPDKPCGEACCASSEACVDGRCRVGQGTCQAGEDVCAGDAGTCNGNATCTCGLRFADGAPRCVQFVDGGRDSCSCAADFRCEEDFGPGTICIQGGANCPNCTTNTLGRCARLCPGSV